MENRGKARSPSLQRESDTSRTVTSIGDWRTRKANRRPVSSESISPARTTLTRSERQAALLRLLLSDEITDDDLDAMLQAARSILAVNRG